MSATPEKRCLPGLPEPDPECTRHPEHFWCKPCGGYFGVPHDNRCHSARAADTKDFLRPDVYCVCTYCRSARKARA